MYELNTVLIFKKPHPCGGEKWKIVRMGADIKIQCLTCGKYVNLTREDLKRRVKDVERIDE